MAFFVAPRHMKDSV